MQSKPSYPPTPWSARDVWLGLAVLGLLVPAAIPFAFLAKSGSLDLNFGLAVSLGELLLLVPVWLLAVRKYNVGWDALGLRRFKWEMVGLGCGLMLLSLAFNFVFGLFLGLFLSFPNEPSAGPWSL